MTLNQILDHLRAFQENHLQIKYFLFGDSASMDNEKDIDGAVMWVFVDTQGGRISETQFTYNMNIAFLDLLNPDLNNLEDVLSDTLQIAQDLAAWLDRYSETALEYSFSRTSSIQPIREKFESDMAGHMITVAIDMPFPYDKCQMPTVDGEDLPSACDLFLGRITSEQWECIQDSGHFSYTYIVNVNGYQSATGSYDPLDSNTFNIQPTP